MKKYLVFVATALFVVAALAPGESRPVSAGDGGRQIHRKAAAGDLRPAQLPLPDGSTKDLPFLSAGAIAAAQAGVADADDRFEKADGASGAELPANDLGAGPGSLGCSSRTKRNTRVNQDCSFRRQAEEDIVFNPAEPTNLVAGQNDSRVGFNQCGIDWSTDNGKHWGDLLPPFRQKVNNPAAEEPTPSDPNRHTVAGGSGTLHTYDAGSDPTVAFDSQGRAFFSCVAFDVFSDAALIYVTQSPAGAHGSYFRNLATFGRNFVVAEDNSPAAVHDKEFITADTFAASPNRDNVYVTWTVFNFTCGPTHSGYCSSAIYGSMSTNHGLTWSTPEEISGRNAALCGFGGFFTGNPADNDKCNFDQGSDPGVLPNGDLVVVFNNGNT